tara:strand:+ start:1944 stop:3779 length:1836 start_codon:yes stop_codon:yes gene_type:complete
MNILGISAFYHDSAASLLQDGQIIAAAQEERFSRVKHDSSFPRNAILYCLDEGGISPEDIDFIVFYEKPFLKFERLLETYLAFAPKGFKSFSKSMPLWIKDKLFQKRKIEMELEHLLGQNKNLKEKILFSEHHLSHAASAFFPSPFQRAAILTLDGVGEWTTTSYALGNGNHLTVRKEIHFPHSLGLLYSAFTYYAGFKVNSGEYKLMGLAPYGEPKYSKKIKENLISIRDDGSFRLDMSFFDYCTGLTMTSRKFNKLFGGSPRLPESEITQKEMDLAASIQKVTEEIILKLAKSIRSETGEKNLCLAGGVALNCVANGILVKEKIFDNIWIQPAAGDAGGSLGAALAVWYLKFKKDRKINTDLDSMKGSLLGPNFLKKDIEKILNKAGAVFHKLNDEEIIHNTVEALISNKAVGWMQGRMEFGPRALGNRSIIADPRSPKMQKQLNIKVKYRESFRPFAPSVLIEDAKDWFDIENSPYMLLVGKVAKKKQIAIQETEEKLFGIDKLNIQRSTIPAVTHVDSSARIQTVHRDTNSKYHNLIKCFKDRTGCPVLVNTSFNIRGEPIVCNAFDAYKCFMGTDLDLLVIENFILYKDQQKLSKEQNYKDLYELD